MASKFSLIILILATLLTGCNLTSTASVFTPVPTVAPTPEFIQPTPLQPISPVQTIIVPPTALSVQQIVLDRAAEVIALLKNKDMTTLAGYVHPKLGLRFSPYAAVKDTDQVFSAENIYSVWADKRLYTWGNFYGSGAPIDLSFADYYSQFVYDVDFANAPQEALNHRLGVSTTLDNIFEFYPSAMFVEYYFPGFDPKYEGMDWRSLRLVFMQDNGDWYLVGIVHDQWTT